MGNRTPAEGLVLQADRPFVTTVARTTHRATEEGRVVDLSVGKLESPLLIISQWIKK